MKEHAGGLQQAGAGPWNTLLGSWRTSAVADFIHEAGSPAQWLLGQ